MFSKMSCACACSGSSTEKEPIQRCCQDEIKEKIPRSTPADGEIVKYDSKGIYGAQFKFNEFIYDLEYF